MVVDGFGDLSDHAFVEKLELDIAGVLGKNGGFPSLRADNGKCRTEPVYQAERKVMSQEVV